MSSPGRWKRHERAIADMLNGRRLPNNGSGQPDVVVVTPGGHLLAVQVKTRATLPGWLTLALDQARRDALATDPSAVPVVVLSNPTPSVGTRRLAVVDLDTFAALTGIEPTTKHKPL